MHRRLARFNHHRLTPVVTTATDYPDDDEDVALNRAYLSAERLRIAKRASQVPDEPDAFLAWFEDLKIVGPGQGDPLFQWLATSATCEDFNWFLTQELAGEAGFDDLVALTQVKMPERAKMEMARNFWDEFGRGNKLGVHGTLLARVAAELALAPAIDEVVWESLALANLLVGLALDRRYAYQSVGALGVIEMTAPGRVDLVNRGLKRLGFSASTRHYYELHASLDVIHSQQWNREVLRPLVASDRRIAACIAEGALMRLEAGQDCFCRYRIHFGLHNPL